MKILRLIIILFLIFNAPLASVYCEEAAEDDLLEEAPLPAWAKGELKNPFSNQLPKKITEKTPTPTAKINTPAPPKVKPPKIKAPMIPIKPPPLPAQHLPGVGTPNFKSPGLKAPSAKPRIKKKPLKKKTISMPALNVTGMIWNSERPQAIINNRIVESGDIVENVEITNITHDGVYYKYNDKESVVRIKDNIKQNKSK